MTAKSVRRPIQKQQHSECDSFRAFVEGIEVDGPYTKILSQLGVFTLSVCENVQEIKDIVKGDGKSLGMAGDVLQVGMKLSQIDEKLRGLEVMQTTLHKELHTAVSVIREKTVPLNIEGVTVEQLEAKLSAHEIKTKKEAYDKIYSDWIKPALWLVVGYLISQALPKLFGAP